MAKARNQPGRYDAIIVEIFQRHYQQGIESFEFSRSEFAQVADYLNVVLPKNIGDVLYSFRFLQRSTKGNLRHCNHWFGMGDRTSWTRHL